MSKYFSSFFDQSISSSNTGLSPKVVSALKHAGIKQFYDLIWILPNKYLKLHKLENNQHLNGDYIQGSGKVIKIEEAPKRSFAPRKLKVRLTNCTIYVAAKNEQFIKLLFYNLYPSQIEKLKKIEMISFWGKVDTATGIPVISTPQWTSGNIEFDAIQSDYPMVNKIPGVQWRGALGNIPTEAWDKIIDPLPKEIIRNRFGFSLGAAFKVLHHIGISKTITSTDIEKATERLIYHEFFIDHYRLIERKQLQKRQLLTPITITKLNLENAIKMLPFELTSDQLRAVEILCSELQLGQRISRLIQGDVGCGKTSVALIVAHLIIQASEGQVALMCPTEALAQQHFNTFQKILPPEYPLSILLGSTPTKAKKSIYKACAEGKIKIIIGTHSLLNDDLFFQDLRLAVIDEQHRFGVEQRMTLVKKGPECHCILMTATPIPRTLLIAQYGDLDITSIHSMPKNRAKRSTRLITDQNFHLFLSFVKTRVQDLKEQAFFVVPAIEESEDLIDLEKTYENATKWFPEFLIGKVHGKMSSPEKSDSLNDFYNGKTQILVCTSVIEVGIDIPNSSIMAIFNPDRFGLSSLHQLRGRVARGSKPGFCFLITHGKLSTNAAQRLLFLEKNEDGFKISEYDLINRGGGDIFGAIQSGRELGHKIADTRAHYEILEQFVSDLPLIEAHSDKSDVKQSVIERSIIHTF